MRLKFVKKLTFILIILWNAIVCRSQDPQFTQFYSNPLYLAPSFAGAIEGSRVATVYRNQWSGLAQPFVTYTLSYDHYFSNFNSGVGILFLRDFAGAGKLGITNLGIQYSYNFKIFDYWHVRPGVHFCYTQSGINFYELTFNDQLNGTYDLNSTIEVPTLGKNVGDIDFATSLLVYSKRVWFGGTVDHLLKPNHSLIGNVAEIPLKFTAFGGVELVRRGRLLKPLDETLTFAALFRHQGIHKQLDFGLYWYKMPFVLGAWYRGIPMVNSPRGDAISFLAGYKLEKFSIGYSYDFTISNLITSTNGAHEISVVFSFKTQKKKKFEAVPCPHF